MRLGKITGVLSFVSLSLSDFSAETSSWSFIISSPPVMWRISQFSDSFILSYEIINLSNQYLVKHSMPVLLVLSDFADFISSSCLSYTDMFLHICDVSSRG